VCRTLCNTCYAHELRKGDLTPYPYSSRRVTPEQQGEIVALRRAGRSMLEVSAALDIKYITVRRHCRVLGVGGRLAGRVA
jgi:DNA invertase Pin-like site-specific DNA recombinase